MSEFKQKAKRVYDRLFVPFETREEDEATVVKNEVFFIPVIACLEQGLRATIPAKGFSMLPFIRGMRDHVVLEKQAAYHPGDIVLFTYHNRVILHRIQYIRDGVATIQGDGVPRNQEVVPLAAIHGKAIRILRNQTKSINPDSRFQRFLYQSWKILRPIRRPLLLLYRFVPWNYAWLRKQ